MTKEHGNKKIFCQQQDALLRLKVPGAVLKVFWADFWKQIDQWLEEWEKLVIGGDWNEEVTKNKFLQPFLDRSLIPAIQHRHGTNLPATYKRGSCPIDKIFCSSTIKITQAGYGVIGDTKGNH